MTQKVAVIGAGLIGRSWSIVFARAGYEVTLFDQAQEAVEAALALIADALPGLAESALLRGASVADVRGRIRGATDLPVAFPYVSLYGVSPAEPPGNGSPVRATAGQECPPLGRRIAGSRRCRSSPGPWIPKPPSASNTTHQAPSRPVVSRVVVIRKSVSATPR